MRILCVTEGTRLLQWLCYNVPQHCTGHDDHYGVLHLSSGRIWFVQSSTSGTCVTSTLTTHHAVYADHRAVYTPTHSSSVWMVWAVNGDTMRWTVNAVNLTAAVIHARRPSVALQRLTRNSAVADKPRDALMQYAVAWLTLKYVPPPCVLPGQFGHSTSQGMGITRGPSHWSVIYSQFQLVWWHCYVLVEVLYMKASQLARRCA